MSRRIAHRVLRGLHTPYAIRILTSLLLCVSCSSPALTPTSRINVQPSPPGPELNAPTSTGVQLNAPTLTPARTPAASGLYVDAGQDLGAISPLVFGTNYGPTLFVPLQMQPQAKD